MGGEGWKRGRARIWRTHRRETRAPLHAYTPKKKSKKKKKQKKKIWKQKCVGSAVEIVFGKTQRRETRAPLHACTIPKKRGGGVKLWWKHAVFGKRRAVTGYEES